LLFPGLFASIPSLWICLAILAFYIYLNCQNLRIGLMIQKCFVAAKTLPILGLILLGIYNFDINIFNACQNVALISFVTMLPTVLYCFTGFEATCSMSRNIENSEINGPKAIFYSFFAIILIYIAFQTLISMMILPQIGQFSTYADAYPFLMTLVPVAAVIQTKLATLLSFLIGFSAMGAAYGILFSNSWNLYTLAQHDHTIASESVRSLNKHGVPVVAVFAEGLLAWKL
jgi:APA family basic amino acid/polyamine antiporter